MTATTFPPFVRVPLYLGGEDRWSDQTIQVEDPARPGVIIGEAAAASRSDIVDAVAAARAALASWQRTSAGDRADAIVTAAARYTDQLEMDALILSLENGKILEECRRDVSMLARRAGQATVLAPEVDAERVLAPDLVTPLSTSVMYQPLGVVTIIIPFNWPVGILSSALPYALLAGNTVIVKTPPTAPLATTRIVRRMAEMLPPGVLNVVTGHDDDMTELIANPEVAKVCFTGSVSGGKRIMELAAQSLTRVTLELGGNDPAIVLEDALLNDEALDRLYNATFSSTGQICMNAKRAYVHRSRVEDVVGGLSERLSRVQLGHGSDDATTMGPLHSRRQKQFVEGLVDHARASGATVLSFGTLPEDPRLLEGHFVRPMLVLDADPHSRIVSEEQFGPVLPIIAFDTDEEAIALANDSWAGLGASVWSADPVRAEAIARRMTCGYVWINDHGAPRLDLRAPFGGMKQSGMGREQGIEGVRGFQDTRAVSRTAAPPGGRP